ncbi:MAG: sugar ABC transporter substrate-binding protein, partial [Candidatus Niameybacter stercoravium]|nr:sugar ABC transporter substrate-binding protein [Candidatus Niameybacter stercoravium]
MKHKNDILYILALIILVMLYLISSTDFIYKEQETDIYQISVILNETSDAIFENIKLGMNQMDKEWTTEVNIVTLYEANHAEQQMKLVEREVANGAKAIILFPVDAELTKEYLI